MDPSVQNKQSLSKGWIFATLILGVALLFFITWLFWIRGVDQRNQDIKDATHASEDKSKFNKLQKDVNNLKDKVNGLKVDDKEADGEVAVEDDEKPTQGSQSTTGTNGANGSQGIQGAAGASGINGTSGTDGAAGPQGPPGPAGPPGVASCPNGVCVSLQASSPGVQEAGNINISGAMLANSFSGDGAGLTNVDATSLNGQSGSFYQDADNINVGTLNDARLSNNVSLLGSSIQDAEVDDNLTIGPTGGVDWTALLNYPSGCGAGTAVVAIADSLTCSNFLQGTGQAFLQDGNSFSGLATLGTNDSNALAFETNGTEKARFTVAGQLQLNIQGPLGGLLIGDDATLYDGGASILATTNNFQAGLNVISNTGTLNSIDLRTDFGLPNIVFGQGTLASNTGPLQIYHYQDQLLFPTNKQLGLGRAGGTQLAESASGALGDKIAMFGTALTNRYGFGMQSNRLVAYTPTGTAFSIRTSQTSGQASGGADAITLFANGTATFTGTGKNAVQLTATAADTGITFGGDTNIYRPASTPNTLQSDDDLRLINGSGASASPANIGRLLFDNAFDTTGASTANKIVLYDDGATFKAGLGVSTDSMNLFSGGQLAFYTDHVSEASPGNAVFTLANATGAALFKSGSTNVTNALQVAQSGAGNVVFDVDTLNQRVGIGTATPGFKLHVVDTNTATTGIQSNSVSAVTVSPTGTPAAFTQYNAAYNTATVGNVNINGQPNTFLIGETSSATNSVAGATLGNGYGQLGLVQNSNATSSITNAIGVGGLIQNTGAGTIANAYSLYAFRPSNAGTLTNAYGVYVEDQSVGTNRYGLYFAGTANSLQNGITWNNEVSLYRSGTAAVTLKPPAGGTDSANLFQVQNQGGASLLNVNAATATVTVTNLVATATITTPSLTINGGTAITGHLSATQANLVSANIGIAACANYGTITVTGAAVGDTVTATPTAVGGGIETVNLTWSATVTAANTVTIRACNPTLGAIDTADTQTWRADVWKH